MTEPRLLSLLQTVPCRYRSAGNSYNLLCCRQLQSGCISWVRSSHWGFAACAPARTSLLIPSISEHAYADTRRDRQIVSLSVYDPQGQQPAAAPVAPFQTLNDLSKQRLQNFDGEHCFIYRLRKWKFCGTFKEVSQMSRTLKKNAGPLFSFHVQSSRTRLCCGNRGSRWSFIFSGLQQFGKHLFWLTTYLPAR